MNTLVTGGAGYIGSAVVKALLGEGHSVVVIDNLSHGHEKVLKLLKVPHYVADIRDKRALKAVFAKYKFDAVLHFANLIEAGESMKEPVKYFDNNIVGTLRLLEAMAAHNVQRIVFSSSAAIYGEPTRVPIPESAPLKPINIYGETKLWQERLLHWWRELYSVSSISLRYFNAAGADEDRILGEDHRPESHLIPIVLQVASGKRPCITIFGSDYPTPDGTCIRDFIHVSDLAAAHLLALKALEKKEICEAFNVGLGKGYSVKQVIAIASRVTGRRINFVIGPRREGDPAKLVADPKKIQRQLGWRPRFRALEPIIESAWRWQLRHPHGYD